ncbi:MAG: hypothetical protein KKA65_03305 [Nanoarchaeota archaeon]|nr:hypothetical protein [Nanoarchaeota archaeon]MBU4352022.1 hypothetical protein [Nanoarchaeota archaeon]MBU4456505.1 hypothetical protein [Nanoarchaeota archaeon]
MKSWRDKIDPLFKEHLEALISESVRHRDAYKFSSNTSNAQLWCALSVLQKQVFDQNLKIKFLEKALQETLGKKPKKDDADPEKALRDVLKRL